MTLLSVLFSDKLFFARCKNNEMLYETLSLCNFNKTPYLCGANTDSCDPVW
jgi:hypothetical protein